VPVSRMDQVLEHALVRLPQPIEWEEPAHLDKAAPPPADDEASVVAH
jgi:ATP-dependent Lon protease